MGATQTSQLDTAASPFHTDTVDIGCPFQETSILASVCALREDKSGLFIETEGQLVSLLSCGDWNVFSTSPCTTDVNIKISLTEKKTKKKNIQGETEVNSDNKGGMEGGCK